jgi:hypothetical protein
MMKKRFLGVFKIFIGIMRLQIWKNENSEVLICETAVTMRIYQSIIWDSVTISIRLPLIF